MHKRGTEQVSVVAARGARTIRLLTTKNASLTAEAVTLREKVAGMERDRQVETIAAEMEEKGLNAEMTLDEKIAHIRTQPDLGRVEDAVKMASSSSIRLATVTDEPGRGQMDSLSAFCLGGD